MLSGMLRKLMLVALGVSLAGPLPGFGATQAADQKSKITARPGLWQTVRLRQREASNLLGAYAKLNVPGIQFRLLAEAGREIQLEGRADSEDEVANLARALTASGDFSAPTQLEMSDRGDDKRQRSFHLRTSFKPPENEASKAKQGRADQAKPYRGADGFDEALGEINDSALAEGLRFDMFRPTQAIRHPGYLEVPVELIVLGDLGAVRNFLAGLESRRIPAAIGNMRLEGGLAQKDELKLRAHLSIFMEN